MGFGAKKPKKTAEEKALLAAQTRELSRQDEALNERKRRIIRAQTTSRASMLSGLGASREQIGNPLPGPAGQPLPVPRRGRGRFRGLYDLAGVAGGTGVAGSAGGGAARAAGGGGGSRRRVGSQLV